MSEEKKRETYNEKEDAIIIEAVNKGVTSFEEMQGLLKEAGFERSIDSLKYRRYRYLTKQNVLNPPKREPKAKAVKSEVAVAANSKSKKTKINTGTEIAE